MREKDSKAFGPWPFQVITQRNRVLRDDESPRFLPV